jgi:hypothetical protein
VTGQVAPALQGIYHVGGTTASSKYFCQKKVDSKQLYTAYQQEVGSVAASLALPKRCRLVMAVLAMFLHHCYAQTGDITQIVITTNLHCSTPLSPRMLHA